MKWGIIGKEKVAAKPNSVGVCPLCNEPIIPKCGAVKVWHWAHKSKEECDSWGEPETKWHIDWKNEFPDDWQEVRVENQFAEKHRADIRTENELIIEFQNSTISADDICDREGFYEKMIWVLNGKTLGKGLNIYNKGAYFTFQWKNPPQSWFNSDKPIYIDLQDRVDELNDLEKDILHRLSLAHVNVHQSLSKFLGKGIDEDINLQEFNFDKFSYGNKEEKLVFKDYELWSDLSQEFHRNKDRLKLYDGKSILLIKKIYKKIPCGGWGKMISKEDFIKWGKT